MTAVYEPRIAQLRAQLDSAKAKANVMQQRAETRARSNAATDRLYASLPQLSASAQADSTVQHLKAAAQAVAVELDSTKRDVVALIAANQAERAASDSMHAADSVAVHALGVQSAAQSDTIKKVTAERDAKVSKGKVVAIASAVGTAGITIGIAIVKVFFGGNE